MVAITLFALLIAAEAAAFWMLWSDEAAARAFFAAMTAAFPKAMQGNYFEEGIGEALGLAAAPLYVAGLVIAKLADQRPRARGLLRDLRMVPEPKAPILRVLFANAAVGMLAGQYALLVAATTLLDMRYGEIKIIAAILGLMLLCPIAALVMLDRYALIAESIAGLGDERESAPRFVPGDWWAAATALAVPLLLWDGPCSSCCTGLALGIAPCIYAAIRLESGLAYLGARNAWRDVDAARIFEEEEGRRGEP